MNFNKLNKKGCLLMKKKLLFILAVTFMLVVFTYPIYATSTISTSKDIQSSNGVTSTFTGYLVDQICAKKGVGFDGSDLIHHPETHTLRCLKMPVCIASGYGIYVKDQKDIYVFYKFDQKGSDLALANIVNKTKKTDNIIVEVTGKIKDNTIMVESILEK
jgi:hypothetical protein